MRLPEIVSSAGTLGNKIVQPSQAGKDTFSDSSYWWLFKDLRDKTNIDWAGRNPIVREEFDALEEAFAAGIPAIISKAVDLRKAGQMDEAAGGPSVWMTPGPSHSLKAKRAILQP
jgi:hypothetical protein